MKIVSEKQLEYIKAEYRDLLSQQSEKYFFEGSEKGIFDNLILFTDDKLYNTIRSDHYLSMTACQRTWNKFFWYLRYQSDMLKISTNSDNHQQPIFKILEEIYQTCDSVDHGSIEPFVNFASRFEKQEYILFDYFHPAITETGVSLKSQELNQIVKLLNIDNFNFEEIDKLIEKNIDNKQADLITFFSHDDKLTYIKVDTFSAGEDQIHPIDIVIKCKIEHKEIVDSLLVSWWTKFWKKMGPFVAIANTDKFERDNYFRDRKRYIQS